MRLAHLALERFGHFTGKVLEFGGGGRESDFHLVYGPNEAGKTTAMEGFLRLLFGFPLREPYDFRHARPTLRVSGLIDIGGQTRRFTRLPTRTGTLRGEADAILPEAAIAAHLGGLSLEDYRRLLCLDDATIEAGGEDIANARGDIGRLLFSAAAGVADLNAVLEQARTEADGLYRKRASTTRVADLKRELDRIERAIRDRDVNADAWRRLREARAAAMEAEATARATRDRLRAEQARIAALRRALPGLGERDRLRDAVAAQAGWPDRLDVDPEGLVGLRTAQAEAEAELRRLDDDIAGAVAARAALVPDAERLALAGRLDDLDDLRSRSQTAALDLSRRERAAAEARADMDRIARDLGAPEGCDPSRLVVSEAEIAGLEVGRDAMRDAAAARETGGREIAGLGTRLAEARRAHRVLLDAPPGRPGLLDLLARFDADALAPAVAGATEAIAAADAALGEALDALAVGACSFAALPDCPADPGTAAALSGRHADLAEEIARRDDSLETLDGEIAAMTARITSLAGSDGIVSDAAAAAAQAQRDALWQAHRAALTGESADRFAPAMARVDAIAAARLARATELGELRKLAQDLAAAQARAAAIRDRRARLAAEAQEIEGRAGALAATIGLPALSPAALSDWVARHARAAAARRQRDRLAGQHGEVLERAERLRQALAPHLALESPSFGQALLAARRLAEAERVHRDALRAASDRTAALETELERRHGEQSTLDDAARRTAAAWTARIAEQFGGMLSPDALAAAPGQLRALREHDAKRQQAERQVRTMQEDRRRFAEAVSALGARFGIAAGDPTEAFRRLRAIADQAQADRARHAELGARIEADTARRAAHAARLAEIDRTVEALGAAFPATVDTRTLDALRIAVGEGREIIAKRARIAELEARVLDDLSICRIDEARALLGDETAPSLAAKAQSLEDDLALAEARLSAATVARANAERDLGAVTGDAEIAELDQQRAALHAEIEAALLDYLERDFGLRLAEEAIRRFRDRHRSDMLAATERAFAALTNGAYATLRTQPDGRSEILLAVDAGGTSKQIAEMSKGTRFQLYLALRAAAYEQMVAQGVQLPFFCDDVFETFDDARTRAACRLMERIGRSGQAIYLTHHRHVVEIAAAVCDVPPVVHEL